MFSILRFIGVPFGMLFISLGFKLLSSRDNRPKADLWFVGVQLGLQGLAINFTVIMNQVESLGGLTSQELSNMLMLLVSGFALTLILTMAAALCGRYIEGVVQRVLATHAFGLLSLALAAFLWRTP